MSFAKFINPAQQPPKPTSNYLKLEEGTTRFRVLSYPIVGWEEWDRSQSPERPYRYRFEDKPTEPMDPSRPLKYFMSMIVWNYDSKLIQILHITQATIRTAITKLCDDPDWGIPFTYDLKIERTGEGKTTEYSVMTTMPKPLDPAIEMAYRMKPIRLTALFDNADPFAINPKYPVTFGFFDEKPVAEPTVIQAPPAAVKAKKPKQSVVNPSEPDWAIPVNATTPSNAPTIELDEFLDFLPLSDRYGREDVEAFVQLCASAANMSPGSYMCRTLDSIDAFVACLTRYLDAASPGKRTSA